MREIGQQGFVIARLKGAGYRIDVDLIDADVVRPESTAKVVFMIEKPVRIPSCEGHIRPGSVNGGNHGLSPLGTGTAAVWKGAPLPSG